MLFRSPEDEESVEQHTWNEWYDLLQSDPEWYDYLCEVLSASYREYYLSDDGIDEELADQESEYDEDGEYEDDEEYEEEE